MLTAPPTRRTLLAMIWLALTVVGLGLPQLLIVCRGDDGAVHLEFWHDPAECCHEQSAREPWLGAFSAGADERGDEPGQAHGRAPGCEHQDLAIGPLPTPRPITVRVPPLSFTAWLPEPPRSPERTYAVPIDQPPGTGPPRLAALLRQLAATHLLV